VDDVIETNLAMEKKDKRGKAERYYICGEPKDISNLQMIYIDVAKSFQPKY
jgi:hypothetical protein